MRKYLIFVTITLFFSSQMFAGGPWPQPKGKGYFKFSEWWIVFDQHYTDAGLKDPNVTTGVFNTSLYAEYGFTDRLTGIFNGPLFARNYMNNLISRTTNEVIVEGEAINTLGDIDLGIKYGIIKGDNKIPLSVSLFLGLPTGKTGGGALNNLQTGDGEFNQMIQVDAGTGFKMSENTHGYLSAFIGFNNRTEGYSEEFRYGLEYGAGLFNRKLWLIGRLLGVESLKNGKTAATITSTSIFANNAEYTSVSIEANYYFTTNLGISVSMAGAFRGEIIAAAPSYSVGIFYDLK